MIFKVSPFWCSQGFHIFGAVLPATIFGILRQTCGDFSSNRPRPRRGLRPAGKLLQDMGRWTNAERLLRESLDMRRNDPALGPEHPKVKESQDSLRSLLRTIGRSEDAEAVTAS